MRERVGGKFHLSLSLLAFLRGEDKIPYHFKFKCVRGARERERVPLPQKKNQTEKLAAREEKNKSNSSFFVFAVSQQVPLFKVALRERKRIELSF